MSDCNLCVLNYEGDEADMYVTKMPTARRGHICCECGQKIQRGEQYENVTMALDGDVSRYKTCLICVEIRTKFSCDGSWMFGTIWEELREYGFPEMTTGCLDGLSAAAKRRLIEEWNKWKFRKTTV